MRASPAFQITIVRFGVWRAAVLVLLLAALACLVAWLPGAGAVGAPLRLAVGLPGVALMAAGAGLLRCAPTSLRWDTRRWHLGPASTMGDEPASGRLAVAIDLGSWMLLRFEHDASVGRRHSTWLPVQRRGLEGQWHALRCAVYSARPAEGHDAGSRPPVSPESQE
jgi:hypothetical protein